MQTASPDLGPSFTRVKPQPHPGRKVHDLGIAMQWGRPRQTARLYRNIRNHAPQIFDFECVVIHEEDARGDFYYQAYQARETNVGMFYPLTAYMVSQYNIMAMSRNIFAALAELDRLLPPERHVTEKEVALYCRSLGKAKPLPPEPRAEPPTGLLTENLEAQGFRLTCHVPSEGRVNVGISWLARPGGHWFFTGAVEMRPTEGGLTGHWRLPGPCGVNRLLRREFEQKCEGLVACLSPAGRRCCLAGTLPPFAEVNGCRESLP